MSRRSNVSLFGKGKCLFSFGALEYTMYEWPNFKLWRGFRNLFFVAEFLKNVIYFLAKFPLHVNSCSYREIPQRRSFVKTLTVFCDMNFAQVVGLFVNLQEISQAIFIDLVNCYFDQ